MLKDASIALASSTNILSSAARTKSSLKALDTALSHFEGTHHLLQLNWDDRGNFLDSLSTHIKNVGIPSLVVAWLHEDSLGPELAKLCISPNNHCDFFQVRGSSAADPSTETSHFANQFDSLPGVSFHQVILGFMKTSSGSRWLRNSEISQGVLDAINTGDTLSIVGTVEPWEERP